jgi:hypothetical protein
MNRQVDEPAGLEVVPFSSETRQGIYKEVYPTQDKEFVALSSTEIIGYKNGGTVTQSTTTKARKRKLITAAIIFVGISIAAVLGGVLGTRSWVNGGGSGGSGTSGAPASSSSSSPTPVALKSIRRNSALAVSGWVDL